MIGPETELSEEALRILEEWDRESVALDGLVAALRDSLIAFKEKFRHLANLAEDPKKALLACEAEFYCFLLHMVSRVSLIELGFGGRDRLMQKLAGPTSNMFIHSAMSDFAVDEQERVRVNLPDSIREAESRYGRCSKIINLDALKQSYLDMTLDDEDVSGGNQQYWAEIGLISPNVMSAMDSNYLFGQLGTRMITVLGKPQDAKAFVDVTLATHEICNKMELGPLVKNLGGLI